MRRLFEREYPSLVRFLYRHLGDRDQAEDLAQDAFVRLLDQRPRNPRAWLFTVALNLARDALRGETRRASHLQLVTQEYTAERIPSPEEATVREETAEEVRTVLGALSERDRTLLLLWEEKLSYRQIAETLGVAPSSVGPLLARAQRRFLERYNHSNEEGEDAASG
jgi:RNA polymerase sigma-70 factor (ECF subfamily)